MATNTPKPIHSLVIDAGPIIKNEPPVSTLLGQAESLFTIPAIIHEIRDAVTRSRVESTLLPFLTVRSPKPGSIKVIADFAGKTGDKEVLSMPDIHLMALAYELECERNHGDWRLRNVPGQKRLNGAPPCSLTGEAPQSALEEKEPEATQPPQLAPAPIPKTNVWGTAVPKAPTPEPNNDTQSESIEEKLENTPNSTAECEPTPEPSAQEPAEPAIERATTERATTERATVTVPPTDPSVEEVQESESEGSDGEGWITPSNLKKHQKKDNNGSTQPEEEVKTMQVACITSDFAMQNVLLRMNLNLLSPSLQRIRQLKTWVLRCHACFKITKNMSKQFCPSCGKDTLLRTSCSTDKDGNFKVHLKKNMQWNKKGNVYSIPKPVVGSSNGKLVSGGGKGGWGQGLILAEDQKEYVNAMTGARRKKERDLMDEDYLPSILSGDRGKAGGRPKVGAGKNVNSRKRK